MNKRGSWLIGLLPFVALGCGGSSIDTPPADDTGADVSVDANPCKAAELECGGVCVDPQSAHDNCGVCGKSCGASEACVAGACSTSCPTGQSVCDGKCATVATDNANCGACGTKCSAGQVCSNGACAATCASTLATCGGVSGDAGADGGGSGDAGGAAYCANTQTDNQNCGACGTVCDAGQACKSGTCALTCGTGLNACGGVGDGGVAFCANFQTDNVNCGACGTKCGAGQVCSNGACATTCAATLTTCGGASGDAGTDGGASGDAGGAAFCANTQTDNQNCGACGTVCGAGQACKAGACTLTCGTGLNACGSAGAAYCSNFQTDNANCGACGNTCGNGQTCQAGVCQATCGAGQTKCAATAGAAGYCANLQSDPANCGTCGTPCGTGLVCSAGVCAPSCMPFATCPGVMGGAPFCSNTTTDANNCGACGTACGAGKTCVASACVVNTLNVTADTNLSLTNTGGRTCADGGDLVAYSVTGLTATTATVSATVSSGCLAVGDEVLLINLQGTATAAGNTGNYESLKVASVSGATVTFVAAKTKFYGDGASNDTNVGIARTNQRVVLQRVPTYADVTVANGVTLTANAWNGSRGGVFAIRATGNVTVNGTLSMKGAGFVGGGRTTTASTTGFQGEALSGLGGVDERNLLGAGGAGIGDGFCTSFGAAGGGGGHASWGGHGVNYCAGSGGGTYGDATLARAFFGSGGGSGGTDNTLADNPQGAKGGIGGGIVMIRGAKNVYVNGRIDASGADGEGDVGGSAGCLGTSTTACWDFSGPGGGGAGGSVVLDGAVSNLAGVLAMGGQGGQGVATLAGNGGNGGNGRVFPLLQTCADIGALAGDGEYQFALGGDPAKLYRAYCTGVGTANPKMYLTLGNTGATRNFTKYDATQFGGTIILTQFTRVRFDPKTMLVTPDDYTFTTSTGSGSGGPFGPGVTLTHYPYGQAGDCWGGAPQGAANVDLRGLPFAIAAGNTWTVAGAGPAGGSVQSVNNQVVDMTGGGSCGWISPSTNGGKILLAYAAQTATSCAAIKTATATAPDGVYAITPDASLPALPVYCDMTTGGGGWMLLLDTAGGVGPGSIGTSVPVGPGSATALPMSITRVLATGTTQVHVRTTGLAATRSVTSVASAAPIVNLRNGQKLNIANYVRTDYTGPLALVNLDTQGCAPNPKAWPDVYHACGNGTGTHLLFTSSTWANGSANEPMQVYVK
jgi:hypothetical protein